MSVVLRFREYLKQIVYGGNDGIVTTFAVVSGFQGASAGDPARVGVVAVLLFGLANLFGDATSMGLGDYLSERSEREVNRRRHREGLRALNLDPEGRAHATQELLKREGFSVEVAARLVSLLQENPRFWNDFLMRYEHDVHITGGKSPAVQGLVTFVSFVIFGFIPLLPYLLTQGAAHDQFALAAGGALLALAMLGVLKWRAVGGHFARSVLEVLLIGMLAGAVAYFVGTFFEL